MNHTFTQAMDKGQSWRFLITTSKIVFARSKYNYEFIFEKKLYATGSFDLLRHCLRERRIHCALQNTGLQDGAYPRFSLLLVKGSFLTPPPLLHQFYKISLLSKIIFWQTPLPLDWWRLLWMAPLLINGSHELNDFLKITHAFKKCIFNVFQR